MIWSQAIWRSGLVHFVALGSALLTSIFLWSFLQNPLDLYRTGLELSHPHLLKAGSMGAGLLIATWLAGRAVARGYIYLYVPASLLLLGSASTQPGYYLSAATLLSWIGLAALLHYWPPRLEEEPPTPTAGEKEL